MQYKMFTIYDSCAGIYQRPFIARAEGEAIRSFADIAQDKQHPIGQHPEHYSLYEIASFDDADAELKTTQKKCVATAQELISQASPQQDFPYQPYPRNAGGTD